MIGIRTRRAAALLLAFGLAAGVAVVATAPLAEATPGSQDPPLTVPTATLDAALHCSTPFDDTREPVLLVHGTFTNDDENYGWNYQPALLDDGFDVCTVTLPNRSLDDIQVSAEYVVHAVREMSAMAGGRQIDLLGHSQGGLQPRWMTRFYPHTRDLVDDLVTLATPHHGTASAEFQNLSCGACWQMSPSSDFITAMNSGDESPGTVDYTSIFTEAVDELVQPQPAASTIAPAANVASLSIQAVCLAATPPNAKVVDHVTIVADTAVHDLVLDAFTQDGPANPTRAEPDCVTPFFPTLEQMNGGGAALENLYENPTVPAGSTTGAEPPTAFYARAGLPTFSDVRPAHWAYWEIEWAAAQGVATGVRGRFAPREEMRRAVAVMWLWRLAGQPTGAPDTNYRDVPRRAWYHDGLDWAADEGIVRAAGRFRPRSEINRAQLAAWLWAYAGRPAGSPHHPFTDVPSGAWYGPGLDWAAAEGIVTGFPGPTYRPRRWATRAGVSTMLFRLDRLGLR